MQVPASDEFLDEQARHDGLAGTGVVGEQKAQRLARQHGLVDGGDLVRVRVDLRGVHRQHRVEQVREPDALGLGHQAKKRPITVEAPRPALGCHLQAGFVAAVEKRVANLAAWVLVGQLDRVGPEPLHADDRDQAGGQDALHGCVRSQVVELCHAGYPRKAGSS